MLAVNSSDKILSLAENFPMKGLLFAGIFFFCCAVECLGQDLVKFKNSGELLLVKILDINELRIRYLNAESEEKIQFTDLIDSLYSQNEPVVRMALKIPVLSKRLSEYPLTPGQPKIPDHRQKEMNRKTAPTVETLAEDLAKTKSDMNQILFHMQESGHRLNTGGVQMLVGAGSGIAAGVFSIKGMPKTGLAFSALSLVSSVLGYINIARSGKMLNRVKGSGLNISLTGSGAGLEYRF